jgi:hypothetical protein
MCDISLGVSSVDPKSTTPFIFSDLDERALFRRKFADLNLNLLS